MSFQRVASLSDLSLNHLVIRILPLTSFVFGTLTLSLEDVAPRALEALRHRDRCIFPLHNTRDAQLQKTLGLGLLSHVLLAFRVDDLRRVRRHRVAPLLLIGLHCPHLHLDELLQRGLVCRRGPRTVTLEVRDPLVDVVQPRVLVLVGLVACLLQSLQVLVDATHHLLQHLHHPCLLRGIESCLPALRQILLPFLCFPLRFQILRVCQCTLSLEIPKLCCNSIRLE